MTTKFLIGAMAVVLCACGPHKDKGVPGHDSGVQSDTGVPGATPNRSLTVSNSSGKTMVPREGGNLDRGVTKDNDPTVNAPGPNGTALGSGGTSTGAGSK